MLFSFRPSIEMAISGYLSFILIFAFSHKIKGDNQCIQGFKDLEYVPKFADAIGSTDLKVYYNGKFKPCFSMVSTLTAVNPPTLYFNVRSCCEYVTVLQFAPDTITLSPFLTWLTINVPAQNLRTGFTTGRKNRNKINGFKKTRYQPPEYVVGEVLNLTVVSFVYCQDGYIHDKKKCERPCIEAFQIKKYAEEKSLGDPIAASYQRFSITGLDLTSQTGKVLSVVPEVVPKAVPSVASSVVPPAVISAIPLAVPEDVAKDIPVPLPT